MSSALGDKAFTQHWLQSLTLVAREPVAQQIKPLLDTVDAISGTASDADRATAAKRLWDFAESEGLCPVLGLAPIQQPIWVFHRDDPFQYHRQSRTDITDFSTWMQGVGLAACEIELKAEVASRDWLTLARQEAVRLQQSMSTGAMLPGLNLKLDCKAVWDLKGWSIRFSQAEWVVIRYEEPVSVARPTLAEIDECLAWVIASANDTLLPKVLSKCTAEAGAQPWIASGPHIAPLHQRILAGESKHYAPWFRRVWSCVWPVVYREQNVLRGQANVDVVRQELAACITEAPRLTTWMFVFAKLVCECQMGRGLGISGDYLV